MDLGPDHAQQLLTEMVTVGRHVTQLRLERPSQSRTIWDRDFLSYGKADTKVPLKEAMDSNYFMLSE